MQRVRREDIVRVISGKDAGKEGRVIRVYPRDDRVMIEGVNRMTKHRRLQRDRSGGQEGGITHEETPLRLSKVMPVCPSCGEAVRVGVRVVAGERTRVCRKCESEF